MLSTTVASGCSVEVVSIIIIILLSIYASIIGAYVILIKHIAATSKSLANILSVVNMHIQDKTTHPASNKLVYADVCKVVQEKQLVMVKAIDNKMQGVDTKISWIGEDLKQLVKALK